MIRYGSKLIEEIREKYDTWEEIATQIGAILDRSMVISLEDFINMKILLDGYLPPRYKLQEISKALEVE